MKFQANLGRYARIWAWREGDNLNKLSNTLSAPETTLMISNDEVIVYKANKFTLEHTGNAEERSIQEVCSHRGLALFP